MCCGSSPAGKRKENLSVRSPTLNGMQFSAHKNGVCLEAYCHPSLAIVAGYVNQQPGWGCQPLNCTRQFTTEVCLVLMHEFSY